MRTVIIGSGNVAYHLANAFTEAGIPITQIFARNKNAAKEIELELQIPVSSENLADADFYLISVSDDAVEDVSKIIKKTDCLVAHTSGSLPKEMLAGNYRKASFYPMQTFSKNKKLSYSTIPFFIEAENSSDQKTLISLAEKISPLVRTSDYEIRKTVHLTAVFACNFVNHLFSRAKEISDSKNVPFEYFMPLIEETVEKIKSMDPKMAQTGPAVRNDRKILDMHRQLLGGEHLLIYDAMNRSIQEMYEL